MDEKTQSMLIAILAVMLAASIFLNGWLLQGSLSGRSAPENAVARDCALGCDKASDGETYLKCLCDCGVDLGETCP